MGSAWPGHFLAPNPSPEPEPLSRSQPAGTRARQSCSAAVRSSCSPKGCSAGTSAAVAHRVPWHSFHSHWRHFLFPNSKLVMCPEWGNHSSPFSAEILWAAAAVVSEERISTVLLLLSAFPLAPVCFSNTGQWIFPFLDGFNGLWHCHINSYSQ